MPIDDLTTGRAPQKSTGTERHSLSAHQAAQPQREPEVGRIILIPVLKSCPGDEVRPRNFMLYTTVYVQTGVRLLLSLSLLLAGVPAWHSVAAQSSTRAAVTLRDVHFVEDREALTAVLELDGPAAFIHATLAGPHRIILDIKNARQSVGVIAQPDEHILLPVGRSGVERVRVGQMGSTVRIVFDTTLRLRYQVDAIGSRLQVRISKPTPLAIPVATTPVAITEAVPIPTPIPAAPRAAPTPGTSSRESAVTAPSFNVPVLPSASSNPPPGAAAKVSAQAEAGDLVATATTGKTVSRHDLNRVAPVSDRLSCLNYSSHTKAAAHRSTEKKDRQIGQEALSGWLATRNRRAMGFGD